ncbi:MAG: tyrosine-type recombinase/integrase [Fimbriimonadaceae bacterium]
MDDDRAVTLFLDGYRRASPHTQRAYRKEVERFVLWLKYTRPGQRRSLPAVTSSTISDYLSYLENPAPFPAEFLLRQGRQIRRAHVGQVASPVPQPFSGVLSIRSKAHAITVLRRLFDVLGNIEDQEGRPYCPFNPLRTMRTFSAKAIRASDAPTERGLSFAEWRHVLAAIEDTSDPSLARQRWIVMMIYLSFVRREEATRLTTRDLTPSRDGSWSLRVFGKGGAVRNIVASRVFMDEMAAYRRRLGREPLPGLGPSEPLILNAWGTGPVQPQVVYKECLAVFRRAAIVAKTAGDDRGAERLLRASPHWLRHTGISHALEFGIEARYVQAQAGHSSLAITGLYDHKERGAWERSFERLRPESMSQHH